MNSFTGLAAQTHWSAGFIGVAAKPKFSYGIEGFAANYQDPVELINYYYSNQQQLQEI